MTSTAAQKCSDPANLCSNRLIRNMNVAYDDYDMGRVHIWPE